MSESYEFGSKLRRSRVQTEFARDWKRRGNSLVDKDERRVLNLMVRQRVRAEIEFSSVQSERQRTLDRLATDSDARHRLALWVEKVAHGGESIETDAVVITKLTLL